MVALFRSSVDEVLLIKKKTANAFLALQQNKMMAVLHKLFVTQVYKPF
jgi:hypothetical protein